ncbi:MAG: hypothetical protein RR588_09620 [Solibacillus sp.]
MKKILLLILGIILGTIFLSACFGMNASQGNTEEKHKNTPEEAISQYIEEEGLDPNISHTYLLLDKYIFMLYNDVSVGGIYNEDIGYQMALPLGFKFQVYIPETPSGLFSSMAITKVGKDYQFEIQGFKNVNGVSTIDEKSPIKVYDSKGNEPEKLFNESSDAKACIWITVLNELPKDYAIYAEDGTNKYTVIDAKTIKELVG